MRYLMANCSVASRSGPSAQCSLRCVARGPLGNAVPRDDDNIQEQFVEEVARRANDVVVELCKSRTEEEAGGGGAHDDTTEERRLVRHAIDVRESLCSFVSGLRDPLAESTRRDFSVYVILDAIWDDAEEVQDGCSRYVAAAVEVAAGHDAVMSMYIKRPDGLSHHVCALPFTLGRSGNNTRAAYAIDRDDALLVTYDGQAGGEVPRPTARGKFEHGGKFGYFQSFADFDIDVPALDVLCG